MTGGDFPAWLPDPVRHRPAAQASRRQPGRPARRVRPRRLPHYRTCFVEKAIRGQRRADIVIANHALVMTQAAFDGARAARGLKGDGETTR
jgi:ATP-dependent DNA helicase DinG